MTQLRCLWLVSVRSSRGRLSFGVVQSTSKNALNGEVAVSFVVETKSVCFDNCCTSLISDRVFFG